MGRKELTREEREAKNLKKNMKNNKKSNKTHTPSKRKKSELNKMMKDFKKDDYSCPNYGIIKHKKNF